MVAFADIQQKREQILRLAEKNGARHPRIFGSVALSQVTGGTHFPKTSWLRMR